MKSVGPRFSLGFAPGFAPGVAFWFALGVFLGGCSFSKDTAEQPAQLLGFTQSANTRTLWSVSTGSVINRRFVRLDPLIDADLVYAADITGKVTAFERESGKRRWRIELRMPLTAGVGGGEGQLHLATRDGDILALDGTNGELLWQVPVGSEVLAAPVAGQGVVVVRTVDGRVLALESEDGKQRWSFQREVPALSLRGTSHPKLVPGGVLVGLDNGRMFALDIDDGRVVWERAVALPRGRSEVERLVDIDAEPVLRGAFGYVTTYQGKVAMLSLENGRIVWSRDTSSYAGLGLGGTRLFLTDDVDNVMALDARNGAVLWKQEKLSRRKLTRPVPHRDYVAVADFEGYVHWLSRFDGRLVARAHIDDYAVIAPPVVDGDTLYVHTQGGVLTAFKIAPRQSDSKSRN